MIQLMWSSPRDKAVLVFSLASQQDDALDVGWPTAALEQPRQPVPPADLDRALTWLLRPPAPQLVAPARAAASAQPGSPAWLVRLAESSGAAAGRCAMCIARVMVQPVPVPLVELSPCMCMTPDVTGISLGGVNLHGLLVIRSSMQLYLDMHEMMPSGNLIPQGLSM